MKFTIEFTEEQIKELLVYRTKSLADLEIVDIQLLKDCNEEVYARLTVNIKEEI